MSGFLLTLLLSFFFFNGFSEGGHESAVVVGTVYCDTCFQQDVPSASHFISGATVAVECEDGKSARPSFRQRVKTNRHGEFKVRLPFSVGKHVKKIEGCSVKLVKSSEPYCAVASSATSSSLHLKSRKQGTHIFSAGFFSFKPLKQPFLCNQKPSVDSLKRLKNKPESSVHPDQLLPPPIPVLPPPILPPNPVLPPPVLPPNPVLPPPILPPNPVLPPPVLPPNPVLPPPVLPPNPVLPPPILPPNPLQPPPILPPNPFQPPPAPEIPNPLQPPPAPEIPNPLQPPPAPLTPSLPPIPVLNPPPSLPSPEFPFPLPPLPFPPVPPFPGVPPAKPSP
ncbi:hypothetical protein V6N13_112492 [Hibiscus sabdariffa]|uniref:Uncharacterized protein n=1 Tax=Hibiscus sabdariffa TaxID=183260 RepID=A0ABR2TNW3_9ROSI